MRYEISANSEENASDKLHVFFGLLGLLIRENNCTIFFLIETLYNFCLFCFGILRVVNKK